MGRGTGKDIDMDEKPSKLTSIKKIAALQMSFLFRCTIRWSG